MSLKTHVEDVGFTSAGFKTKSQVRFCFSTSISSFIGFLHSIHCDASLEDVGSLIYIFFCESHIGHTLDLTFSAYLTFSVVVVAVTFLFLQPYLASSDRHLLKFSDVLLFAMDLLVYQASLSKLSLVALH